MADKKKKLNRTQKRELAKKANYNKTKKAIEEVEQKGKRIMTKEELYKMITGRDPDGNK